MNAGSAGTITGLTAPTNNTDAATKLYVDTSISDLISSAPGTLDTLNELAAALGDDPNFATTVMNEIATKVSKAGDTMTGVLAMSNQKITGLGAPSADTDASTKLYVDQQRDTRLALTGGTMTGAIAMSTNKLTGVGDPTDAQDAVTKNYIDTLFGSTVSAADSAAAAAISESNAAGSASDASNSAAAALVSEQNALASEQAAAASFDSFDDRYLGAKNANPTLDNDGDALLTGALYFNTVANEMRVYDGVTWKAAGSAINGTATRQTFTATAAQTTFTISGGYDAGFADVYLNGVKLVNGVDVNVSSGTDVVLATGATGGDIVDVVAYGAFNVANTLPLTGGVMTGDITFAGTQTFAAAQVTGLAAVATSGAYSDLSGTPTLPAFPTGAIVGDTDTQTLTNKTLGATTLSGTLSAADQIIDRAVLEDYAIQGLAIGATGATATIDMEVANFFSATIDEACTFTFSNPPASGDFGAFVLELTNGGAFTVTYPASVDFPGGTAPTLTAAGVDQLVFTTRDGGTTYFGFVAGLDIKSP
jgi:hypothetical protein